MGETMQGDSGVIVLDEDPEIEVVPPFVADQNIVHVYPENDLRDHDTNTRGTCWCRPSVECTGEGGWVVVHHSMDRREMYENKSRRFI